MDGGTTGGASRASALRAVRLFQLISSGLPIGAFAYSRGLESAVELGWVSDAEGARAWIAGLLEHVQARHDAPVLVRIHRALARGDAHEAARWAEWIEATRESAELLAESRSLGAALARWLRELGIVPDIAPAIAKSHLACFALACVRLEVEVGDAVRGYLWSWLEGAVTAAIKLVPLGQTDGQRILFALAARLETLGERALAIDDDDIGASAPGLAIASALHETQHTRLFRS